MYLLTMFILSTLVNAAPKLADQNKDENEFSLQESLQNEDSLSRLKTMIRKESPKAALYSEEEIKEYFGYSDDSTPHLSDSWLEAQQADEYVNLADRDAGADNGPVSAWDSRNPILADEGQNLKDDRDVQLSKPEDKPSNNKITISIDAVRIPSQNLRDGLSSHVNDEHDNRIANSRYRANPRHNGYFRAYTRSSSASAESLAMLTQKLAKMDVEMGRLKEAVLLQGAVHIKTSERIEMMLLAQGKLAVKNNVDTRKLLKRVRRCCACSGKGKAQRSLHRTRKGRTRDGPKAENNATKISDSVKAMDNSSSVTKDNAEASSSQNSGRNSEHPQVFERSQSDSYSDRNENFPSNQAGNRGTESSRKGTDQSQSNPNNESLNANLQHNNTRANKTSVLNNRHFSPLQSANTSDIARGNQQHGKSHNSGVTTQDNRAEQQENIQRDRHGQMAASSESLFTTIPSKPLDSSVTTPKTTTFYEADTTLSPRTPSGTTHKLDLLPSLPKESFGATHSAHHENVDNLQSNNDSISINSTNKWSHPPQAPPVFNSHRTESRTLSSSEDINENMNTQIPVIKNQINPQNMNAANPDDNTVVKESNEEQKQAGEVLLATKRGDILDPITSTAQHVSATDKSARDMTSTLMDDLSEVKPAEQHSINKGGITDSSQDSTLHSDSFHPSSIPPRQVHNNPNMTYSSVHYGLNVTSSSKASDNNANMRQNLVNDKPNLNVNGNYNDHKDEDEMSTNSIHVHRVSTIVPEGHSHQQIGSQSEERSLDPVSPIGMQQSTETSASSSSSWKHTTHSKLETSSDPSTTREHISEVPGSTLMAKKQFSETTSSVRKSTTLHISDQSEGSMENNDILIERMTPTASPPQVSSTLSKESLGEGSEHMSKSVDDLGSSTTPTTTMRLVEHRDVEMLHQSTTPPVTTTVSTKSSTPGTTVLPLTTTTLSPTSSSSIPYVTSTNRKVTTVTSTVSSAASVGFQRTPMSMKQTRMSSTAATTTAMASTRRVRTETTTETAPTTTTPTPTEKGDGQLSVDLSTGEITNNLPGVEWVVLPSSTRSFARRWKRSARRSPNNRPCVIQGVLKFTFTPPPPRSSSSRRRHRHSHHHLRSRRHRHGADDAGGGGGGGGGGDGGRRRLLLEMEFDRPHRWVFNLGDSIANNGFSGDGSVQENDSEAQGYGKAFAVYGSDKHPNGRQKLLKLANNFIHDRLTLVISDLSIGWDNHRGGADQLTDDSLFALSGQSDGQGPVNYDVFLGLNRVIAGHYRRGHGLCRVNARWLEDEA